MRIKPIPYIFFFFLFSINSFSQIKIITTLPETDLVNPKARDTISNWTKKNAIGIDISQIAFVNWNAGGTNSISGSIKTNFNRTYRKGNRLWVNELLIHYGLNKQDKIELRKTDDAIKFNSTLGYRKDTLSNWYHSVKLNFNTQFTNGYAYPNKEIAISKPFAPAYFFLGVGAENANKEKKRTFYFSPFTLKTTLVLDQRLANQGAFGVVKAVYDSNGNLISEGKKVNNGLGILITGHLKKEVFKNIILENRMSLYSDYLHNFGNIDLDWDIQFELVVNKYVKANIGAHTIYDDDIKAKEEVDGKQITVGPKMQLKQALGVGLVYAF
jgi:hypothetical protein